MKIEGTFLRSRVARRVFALFISCAILPITALALISYVVVTAQLKEQSRQQLKQASKTVGMTIFERLLFVEAELKEFEVTTVPGTAPFRRPPTETRGGDSGRRFLALALLSAARTHTPLLGRIDPLVQLSADEYDALDSGKTTIFSRFPSGQPPRLFMARAIGTAASHRAVLLGEIDTAYLWGTRDENPLPPQTEFCILQAPGSVLTCTTESPPPPAILERVASRNSMPHTAAVEFEWTAAGEEYLASAWTVFLRASFIGAPSWVVVLSQSTTDVLAPVSAFKMVFPAVIVLSLGVVTLLSIAQIRRSLGPLERLREGTRRIAERDFDSQVRVTSGDEFEDLAESFNSMARRLGRQFHALSTTAEVTQSILSSLDTRRIAETVLLRMRDVCPCDHVGLMLTGGDDMTGVLYSRHGAAGAEIRNEAVRLSQDDLHVFRRHRKMMTRPVHELPSCLAPFGRFGLASAAILPVFLKGRLAALVVLGYANAVSQDPEDHSQARLLADQIALALANAGLVEDLNELNWGTLHALARTIDAKSPWTAGHSERVTDLALQIGHALNLSAQEMDVLHRGALLHDLGKLGISADILDKPAVLTEEETQTMRGHVTIGARILEPIAAYAAIVPMVLQHHECFDGSGYTQGLAGDAIHFGARILAVADVVDALSSDRPYRRGMDRNSVIDYVRERGGRQFDPRVVQAFLQVMTQDEKKA